MSESYFQVEMLEKEILSLEKILIGKKAKLAELKTLVSVFYLVTFCIYLYLF